MSIVFKNRSSIFSDMQSYLQSLSPQLTDFNVGSVLNSILDAPSAEMEQLWNALITAFSAAYVATATGEDLDNKAADFGLIRKTATSAIGYVTFGRSSSYNQDFTIPIGTIVQTTSTTTTPALQFQTTAEAILPAGQLNVSSVPITSALSGAAYNITANMITQMSTPPAGIETVANPTATAGGTNNESDDDLKTRIPLYLSSLARGTRDSLEAAALSVNGVASVSIFEDFYDDPITPGYVEVYVADSSGNATDAMIAAVQTQVDAYRAVAVTVMVKKPIALNINVKCWITVASGYSTSTVSANVATAITDFFSRLKLGDEVYRSELIAAISEVQGVSEVNTQTEELYQNEAKSCSIVHLPDLEYVLSSSFTQIDTSITPYYDSGSGTGIDHIWLKYDLALAGTDFRGTVPGDISTDFRTITLNTLKLPIVNEQLTTLNGGIQDLSTLILQHKTIPGSMFTAVSVTTNGIWLRADTFILTPDYFVGSGLNDLTAAGTFTGDEIKYYLVQIDYEDPAGAGGIDAFKWSEDFGVTWNSTRVPITGAAQTLSNGITVAFAATGGHTLNDYWYFTLIHNAGGTNYARFGGAPNTATVGADGVTVTLSFPLPLGTTEVFVQYTEEATAGENTQTDVAVDYWKQIVNPTNTPIADVKGIWLATDTNKVGTNYYIDGTFTITQITLGTITPISPTEAVIIDYWKNVGNHGLKPYDNVTVPETRVARAGTSTITVNT